MSMSAKVQELYARDQKLVLLRLLDEAGRSNDSVLADALFSWGHIVDRPRVRDMLRWLADRGAVRLEEFNGGEVVVAELGAAGEDHLTNRRVIDGVKRVKRL